MIDSRDAFEGKCFKIIDATIVFIDKKDIVDGCKYAFISIKTCND